MRMAIVALLLAALPETGLAYGIDLTWKDCVGTGNEQDTQNFTCTGTINQSYQLICHFKLPVTIPNFVGAAGYLDYQNVRVGDALASAIQLDPNVNYYAFHLVFDNRNRNTCAGCTDRGAIFFEKLELESNDGSPRVDLIGPTSLASASSSMGPGASRAESTRSRRRAGSA